MTRTISHADAAPDAAVDAAQAEAAQAETAQEKITRDAAPDIVANYRRNSRRKMLAIAALFVLYFAMDPIMQLVN